MLSQTVANNAVAVAKYCRLVANTAFDVANYGYKVASTELWL